eukprot:g46296.t1
MKESRNKRAKLVVPETKKSCSEQLPWQQAHDWLDQELERKFSDSTATESSNQCSERDGNVPRKGGSSKRFVPRGERNKPPASQKSRSSQDKQLQNANKALQAKKKNVSKMC